MEPIVISVCDGIKKNHFPISNELFDVDSDKAWARVNGEYFPKKHWKIKDQITDLALVRLLYLASVKDLPQKSPFTRKELSILLNSIFWEKATVVSIFFLAYGANTAIFATLPFLPLLSITPNVTNGTHPSSQQSYFSPLQIAITSAVFGVFANIFSTWSTGTAPHHASNAFNAKQDALDEMESTYNDLAQRLIEFYNNESPEEATYIASKIDVDYLKKQISSKIQDKARGRRILERLRDAVVYINSQGTHYPKEDATFGRSIKKSEKKAKKKIH